MTDWYDEREARARFLLGRLLADVHEDECAAELLQDAIFYKPDLVDAHVALGIACCWLEDYSAMLCSFREVLRLNTQAVRAAVGGEPEEMEALRRFLYQEESAAGSPSRTLRAPAYVLEVGRTVDLAREYLASGRDEKAIEVLERVLSIEHLSRWQSRCCLSHTPYFRGESKYQA